MIDSRHQNETAMVDHNDVRFRTPTRTGATLAASSLVAGWSLSSVLCRDLPTRVFVLATASIVWSAFLLVEPIGQPQAYHDFADRRVARVGPVTVPYIGDVTSNAFILAGGLLGLYRLRAVGFPMSEDDPMREWQLDCCLPIFFWATATVSAGSTYYHWNPNDQTLVWDRLPMTVAFVSIFCYMIEEYENSPAGAEAELGRKMLLPLLAVGVFSVVHWSRTDDLRLYLLVQFVPLVAMSVMVSLGAPRHGGATQQGSALLLYGLAKVCEDLDHRIFELSGRAVSGHSLKHVLAGLAAMVLATMI